MLLGGDTQLIVEGVVPDLLHVVPVGDDTVLNGVLQSQDTLNCQNADTMSKILSLTSKMRGLTIAMPLQLIIYLKNNISTSDPFREF